MYELKPLCADDMFPMFSVLAKIGIKEIKQCFQSDAVREAVANRAAGENIDAETVGVDVAFDVLGVLLQNLPNCKNEIYAFLAQISGMTTKQIAALPMVEFTQMIMDVIQKDEFADFFQAVARLLK